MLRVPFFTERHVLGWLQAQMYRNGRSWPIGLWLPAQEQDTLRALNGFLLNEWQRYNGPWLTSVPEEEIPNPDHEVSTPRYAMDIDCLRMSHEIERWLVALCEGLNDLRHHLYQEREHRGLRKVTVMYPELWLRRDGFQLEWFIWTRARFEELPCP